MARKRQSTVEDLVDLASMLPWWGGLTLAIISFFILSYISNIGIAHTSDVSQIGSFAVKQMIVAFAMFGKLILPFVFIIAALCSFINQRKREKLFSKVENYTYSKKHNEHKPPANPIEKMSWREFEMLISQFFRKQGFSVIDNRSSGPDGGVDLRLKKNGKTTLVQCKHWKSRKVGVQIIREQLGLQFSNVADNTIVVTSGVFTDEAVNFAKDNNITLLGGAELLKIISNTEIKTEKTTQPDTNEEVCPLCSSPMILRTAKKGKHAGSRFWGCSKFPKCKGTKNI